jgi:UrcA family protein
VIWRNFCCADRKSPQRVGAAHGGSDITTHFKERIMSNRALQLAAFVAVAATSGAVGATSSVPANTEQKAVVVHYQPADLDSSAGAEELYQSLSRAARSACDDEAGAIIQLSERMDIRRCEQAAIADAVSTVSSANLTTEYNRHFPNQPLVEKERLSERLHALIILVVG